MPCALYSLVRTNCSDAHLLLGLCVIHLASWCPNRCFTRHPLVFHLAAGWHVLQKELFSCALSPSPALSPFPPTCGSQSVPAPTLCEGLCPGLRAPVLPLMLVYSLWLSAAQLRPQHPYRHRRSTQLCLPELGWESRSVSHPTSRCAHAAGFGP